MKPAYRRTLTAGWACARLARPAHARPSRRQPGRQHGGPPQLREGPSSGPRPPAALPSQRGPPDRLRDPVEGGTRRHRQDRAEKAEEEAASIFIKVVVNVL